MWTSPSGVSHSRPLCKACNAARGTAYLMRLAHLVADTVLTPVTDSFLDLGTLASVDPVTHEVTGTGHYAEMVCEARMRRRQFDQGHIDWIVIRNRSAPG